MSARHENRVLLLALAAGAPGVALGLGLLWTVGPDPHARWLLTLLVVGGWLWAAFALRERVVRPLQTLANLLAALREGDYSIRARGARPDDALGLALHEVNALGQMLREQRLRALEATALLRSVMAEVDVAVLAFDADGRLRLANRAAERLLAEPAARLHGRTAGELGLGPFLDGHAPRTLSAAFPGGGGRWDLRRTAFREGGRPHTLLVLSDVSRALREEEREAWQRLVRVLGHEINNSLAPIQSIAGSLRHLLGRDPLPHDWRDDAEQGLAVVQARAGALGRFLAAYARLARLPPPRREPVDVGAWVRRAAALEARVPVRLLPGPPAAVHADGDQLDQLLINLLRNAADAALETGGGVEVGWEARDGAVRVRVLDQGPGVADTANLFVPFFTTKPNGSGIGLALSRQIAEAHGGTLALSPRADGTPGAEAVLSLPLGDAAAPAPEVRPPGA